MLPVAISDRLPSRPFSDRNPSAAATVARSVIVWMTDDSSIARAIACGFSVARTLSASVSASTNRPSLMST